MIIGEVRRMKHWATFLMVFFGWEFCVGVELLQIFKIQINEEAVVLMTVI